MKYSAVLLDLDGTLLDFTEAQSKALEKTLDEFGFLFSEKALEIYAKCNDFYWAEFEKGLVTKKELFVSRFEDFLDEMGWDKTLAEAIDSRYMQILPSCKVIPESSVSLCKELSKRADIIIATNGEAKGQMKVIESSGIMPYIKGIAVSESVGWPKPDLRFFEYALNLVGPRKKSEVIMIGDSLAADIKGGNDFGIDTCWYNPVGSPAVQGIEATYIIKSLEEILDIV